MENKSKIIIGLALVVLLSSGVAGYEDEEDESFASSLPDITVEDINEERINYMIEHMNESGEDNISISCLIKNRGERDANNVTLGFFVDGKLKEDITMLVNEGPTPCESESCVVVGMLVKKKYFDVHSKDEKRVKFIWEPLPGHHEITIKADPFDQIKESNESNNEASINVYVKDDHRWRNIIIACIAIIVIVLVLIKLSKR
ncbi:MAG: hypothetical protein A7316_05140 [Candidatus Altiarchaeales archaeon WOR_SM1_86-2]|nr:MAG: hypothetical protein A7316_05140 [Candidatus Altiarchaeales archaeon WOR_SM1_86-2]ODS41110.1 MAG: hypothetical protein A7315_07030 [Candidatus Altiarchaeales archaeon WOR_SM1_79]